MRKPVAGLPTADCPRRHGALGAIWQGVVPELFDLGPSHTRWGVIGILRGEERSQHHALDAAGVPRPTEERLRPGDVTCVSPLLGACTASATPTTASSRSASPPKAATSARSAAASSRPRAGR